MPSLVCFQHTTARCGTPYRISPFRKNFILLSGKFYPLASLWYNKAAILRQHRTIPALRLKHRFGGCRTASALPKCSIMSGCGTRIVLRGQNPLALCDRCPCFGSLFPPLAALTFAASSVICAFGLAAAAPRSPYRHLELCGIVLTLFCYIVSRYKRPLLPVRAAAGSTDLLPMRSSQIRVCSSLVVPSSSPRARLCPRCTFTASSPNR